MITEVWKFIVGLAAPEPVPIRQAVSTRIPTSAPYHPTSTIRPTQTIAYHPVTWMELASFLTSDPTNLSANNKFNTDYYTCLDFSIDLVENANKENIKAWIVGVNFYNESEGHAFVAFETTDLGVVYIEPQTDHRYEVLQQGEPLCDAWGKYGCMGTVGSYEFIQCDHSHYCTNYTPWFHRPTNPLSRPPIQGANSPPKTSRHRNLSATPYTALFTKHKFFYRPANLLAFYFYSLHLSAGEARRWAFLASLFIKKPPDWLRGATRQEAIPLLHRVSYESTASWP